MKNKFSENYQDLIKIYTDMHNNGTHLANASNTYDGRSLKYFFKAIKQIIDLTKSQSLIDFGCGKAKFYFNKIIINEIEYKNVIEYWKIQDYYLYDPGVNNFSIYPKKKMDGVICTDVVEHIPPEDVIDFKNIELAKKYLNDNPDIKDRLISNDEVYTAIVVRSLVTTDSGEYRNNAALMNKVSPIVDKYLNKYSVHYAGNPYITGEVPKLIRKDAMRLMILGILIMILLLYMNIRNLKAVAMILAVIILSVISMNGFMGWLFHLTGNEIFNLQ